jgi:cytochrome c553
MWYQGTLGGKYPRVAGMNEKYLAKVLQRYKEGKGHHFAMTVVGGLRTLPDEDIDKLAAYIADIDLAEKWPMNIPTASGNAEEGQDTYMDDCKTCHGRKGEGKASKESPPLRGQYTEFLQRQIELFKKKDRHHAEDPDDETFDEYDAEQIQNILAFISTLDDAAGSQKASDKDEK